MAATLNMRWDDLQILRLIDDFEQSETGALTNGLALMQRMTAGNSLDPNRDYVSFVHELLLARDAGLVIFDERGVWSQESNPLYNANSWLQQIRDIRLTIAGRDRARGRVLMRPLPNPEEDDERPIAGMILEEVARAVGDVYTTTQLPRFLLDSGVPQEYLDRAPDGSKWEYVFDVFEKLHDGGSAARRAMREFLAQWLENRFHTGPRPDLRKRVMAELARQGWFVEGSRLVIGEPQFAESEPVPPIGLNSRIAALHATVREVADRYLESGHMEVAIFEAFKAVNQRVKQITGLDNDGSDLMGKAFGGGSPLIRLADLSTQTGRDIQSGFHFMLMGAVRGIRNPDAHELFMPLDEEEGLEKLAFASMLLRRLDETAGFGRDPLSMPVQREEQ